MWDTNTGKKLYQIRCADGYRSVLFSRDGKSILITNRAEGITAYRADTGEKLEDLCKTNERRGVQYTALLPGNNGIFAVSQSEVWTPNRTKGPLDAKQQFEIRNWTTPKPWNCIAISPDGKTLAMAINEHERSKICLYDVASEKLLAEWVAHEADISSLAFSPDGKSLASGSWDTTILLWDLPRTRLVSLGFQLVHGDEAAAKAAMESLVKDQGAVPFLRDYLLRAHALESRYATLVAELDSERFEIRDNSSRRLEAAGADAEFALRFALEGTNSAEVKKRARNLLEKLAGTNERQILNLLANTPLGSNGEKLAKLQTFGPETEPVIRWTLDLLKSDPTVMDRIQRDGAQWCLEQTLNRFKESQGSAPRISPKGVIQSLSVLEQIGTSEARHVLEELGKGPPESKISQEAKAALARLSKNDKKP
jgi:hypothetical protein